MNDVQPLRGLFDRMVGDPAASAALEGYESLDPALLGDALVAYADTAPVEVAEQLEPYVVAVTGGDVPEPATGWELLASSPVADPGQVEAAAAEEVELASDGPGDTADGADLDFGLGTTELDLGDIIGASHHDPAGDPTDADPVSEAVDVDPVTFDQPTDDWLTSPDDGDIAATESGDDGDSDLGLD